MAKHDIVVLNSTSSGFETDLGNNVARIKGDADNLFSVRDASGVDKFDISSIENSMIVSGDLTLTGNLSSSLSSTASFGRIDVTNLTGDASQMTNVNQISHVSSSKQLAARISGAFQHGFELIGENRVISGSATSTGSFTRVFANVYSGDASDMFDVNEVGHFSSSAQLASNISGSFNKGFEFSGEISGSATSTGSFGKVEFSGKISGNAAAVTIDEAGHFSGSAQLASNISGSFNKGFEFGGALTATQILTASYVGVSGSAFAYAGNATTMSISSICGSDFDYRLEDGITAGKIKGSTYGMGSWSAGPNRLVTAGFGAAAGTQNSYLAMGGYTPTGTDATEKYDGSSWAASAKLTIADCAFAAAGTQNAVVVFNGHNDDNGSEIYNGATFSETANRNNSTRYHGAAGTQNAAIVFGGFAEGTNTPGVKTENFDGNTFTALNDMNLPNATAAAGGTQNSAIAAFGYHADVPNIQTITQLWNGTSWSAGANAILARRNLNGHGTQNHFIAAGGQTNICRADTEEWNGTSWSEQNNLPTAKGASANTGGALGDAAIFAGGFAPGAVNTVEFWNAGLSATGSFGRINVDSISGDASQTTGLEQVLPSGTISSSAQIASNISGSFTSGFSVGGIISGSATSTGSFGKYEFGSSISITDVSGLTGVPSSEGFISSSKQIASRISGSFNKGFEFDGHISGSNATSTGSFSRVVANTYNADASNVTGFTLPSGLASGSAGFASQISGSFKGGFEMIEGGIISSSIKFISSSISSSTTEIGMGQGNDGSTSQSIASASFSIGLANFSNLKVNDGAVTAVSHRTQILSQGILTKNEKFVSGSLRGLPRFRQDVLISGSATSTGSYAKLRAESITVKDIVGDVRKPISGSMNHDNYISASFRSVGTDKPIKIPVFGRGHTVNTQQFIASGSMENQKYRTKMGQLFVDNFGRLNMTVQTGSMHTQAGAWESGPQSILTNNGYAATAGTRDAFIMAGPYAASGSAIYDGIGWQRTTDVTTGGHSNRMANCGIGTVDAAFIMRYMSGSQPSNPTGKYAPYPIAPAHAVLQEFWDGVGWYRGPDGNAPTNTHVKRGGTAGKVGSVNSHIVFNGDDYPTATGTAAWNGVTWQEVGPHTPTVRDFGAGFGGVYDGVVAGGASPNDTCVDEWNGTTWATATALPTAQVKAGGAGPQTAGLITGGSPAQEVQEYNGTSWSEGTSLPANISNHGSGGTAGKAFAANTAVTYLWTGGFITGSITTNTDKGYNPFSQNPTGKYLLTKKLQANHSPGFGGAGSATSGSSGGHGGGY